MESSSLNKAHQQHRRAEALLKYKKFDEAIECHEKAAELLEDAIKLTTNSRSIESLKLQKDHHLRQKNILMVKKEQYENSRNSDDINKQKTLSNRYENESSHKYSFENAMALQSTIYRNIKETDSLLTLLKGRGPSGNCDSESVKSFSTTDTDERALSIDIVETSNLNAFLGSKHPKDDATVIEELKMLNEQLRKCMEELILQLQERTKEISQLKEKIRRLEDEKLKATSKKTSSNNLKIITDSSGGTSPYVFSPCSELSPDVNEARPLPPFPPLEVPNFDFTNFVKSNAHIVNSGN